MPIWIRNMPLATGRSVMGWSISIRMTIAARLISSQLRVVLAILCVRIWQVSMSVRRHHFNGAYPSMLRLRRSISIVITNINGTLFRSWVQHITRLQKVFSSSISRQPVSTHLSGNCMAVRHTSMTIPQYLVIRRFSHI